MTSPRLPSSCYEVSLRGCRLQDLFVSFSRPPGSRGEENFVCRLGELQVRVPGVTSLGKATPRRVPPPLSPGSGIGVPGRPRWALWLYLAASLPPGGGC